MNELVIKDTIYLDKYDVHVTPLLTYIQIQQIINAVIKYDNWAERQQDIDLLVLYHATDLTKENIEKSGHELLYKCGLINDVKACIENYGLIQEGIEYTESTVRALSQVLKEIKKIGIPLTKKK